MEPGAGARLRIFGVTQVRSPFVSTPSFTSGLGAAKLTVA